MARMKLDRLRTAAVELARHDRRSHTGPASVFSVELALWVALAWGALPPHYDDGGISGGMLERAGLQGLLQDVGEGLIDQLTRSLADLARLVDRLDAADGSFVSVMQSFNTATGMGRLALDVLLSFAQFERGATAERIRDKIAVSSTKALAMPASGNRIPCNR